MLPGSFFQASRPLVCSRLSVFSRVFHLPPNASLLIPPVFLSLYVFPILSRAPGFFFSSFHPFRFLGLFTFSWSSHALRPLVFSRFSGFVTCSRILLFIFSRLTSSGPFTSFGLFPASTFSSCFSHLKAIKYTNLPTKIIKMM